MNQFPPETWEECLTRHGGDENEARAIFESYEVTEYEPDARFFFALEINELKESGCPIEANWLTVEQWKYLTWIKNAIIIYHTPKSPPIN